MKFAANYNFGSKEEFCLEGLTLVMTSFPTGTSNPYNF